MAQFYFLSVLLNILAGLILIYGRNIATQSSSEDETEDETQVKPSLLAGGLDFNSSGFRLIIGVLCIFVAVMKILSVFRNDVPVIGDFLPVIAGILSGTSLLLEYYVSISENEDSEEGSIYSFFIGSRKYIGIGCIAVGILHFVFPQIIFL